MDIHVGSSIEAVELCWELGATGRADLFRGQTQHWPKLLPSLLRRRGADRNRGAAHLAAFLEWGRRAPQMTPYGGDPFALTAIGQHYGIPTCFLDLTTDPLVAALFAKTEAPVTNGDKAVIYGFLERDLDRANRLAVLRIDVANLWRLEAQQGLFLHVGSESAMRRVMANVIRIHFPRETLTPDERTRLYPVRKSALESVIDQWIYRHQVGEIMELFERIPHRLGIKRVTYPGAFAWRQEPPLEASWTGHDPGWVYPVIEPVGVIAQSEILRLDAINLNGPPRDAVDRVQHRIEPAIRRNRHDHALLAFNIVLSEDAMSRHVSTLANRCWDGLRVLPYPPDELVEAMALLVALLCHCGEGGTVDAWLDTLWGETQLIDVAPAGGHLDTAPVRRLDLDAALSADVYPKLTPWLRRRCAEDPRAIMDYVVDPWLLFDFARFRRLFVTQFVPAAVATYFVHDVREGDGTLASLWSVPFNAALLGFVTLAEYRFRSPLAGEADIERTIFIAPDMDRNDLADAFIACLPAILSGGEPFQVRFTAYNRDPREIWEIDRAVEQCGWIVELGGISVLDVCPSMRDASEPRSREALGQGLGALEVWLIAQRRLMEFNGRPFDEYGDVLDRFREVLVQANVDLEARARARADWPDA